MHEYQSKYFHTIIYNSDAVLEFPEGLPGFPEQTRFVLLEQPANKPLVFLQSLVSPDICFPALPVLAVEPRYELALAADNLRTLGLAEDRQPKIGEEVLCLAIVTIAAESSITANLLAPVVVNWRAGVAVQAVQADSPYSHRHPLVEEGVTPCS